MKKVLLLICVIISIMLASCDEQKKTTYSEEEMREAIYQAEQRAYERGYAEGEYYALGELEKFKSEHGDAAFEAGYERGYEDGYEDGRYGR